MTIRLLRTVRIAGVPVVAGAELSDLSERDEQLLVGMGAAEFLSPTPSLPIVESSAQQGAADAPVPGAWGFQRTQRVFVQSGSALDQSSFVPTAVPAGARGRIVASGSSLIEQGIPGTPVRFKVATVGPDINAPIPASQKAIASGVLNLRRQGVNAIRIHGIENLLMNGTTGDFVFDPDQLDRFDYLLASLKSAGIYWVINPMSFWLFYSSNGANHYSLDDALRTKPRIYTELSVRQHLMTGLSRLLNRVNKYTRANMITDPALAMIELYNEFGPTFVAGASWPAVWNTRTAGATVAAQTWREWLADATKSHGFGDIAAANSAWGTAYANFAGVPDGQIYSSGAWPSDRFAHTSLLYALYLEEDLSDWLASNLVEIGYAGLTSAENLYTNAMAARAAAKFSVNSVSNFHLYAQLARDINPGTAISGPNNPISEWETWALSGAVKNVGKPLWPGEVGWAAWGTYRNQFPLFAAQMSMQDAACMSFYSQGDIYADRIWEDPSSPYGVRNMSVFPYVGTSDPTFPFTYTALGFIHLRKDVSPHAVSKSYTLNDRYMGISPVVPSRTLRALVSLNQPLQFAMGLYKVAMQWDEVNTDDSLAATENTKSWLTLLQDAQSAGAVAAENAALVSATANSGTISGFDISVPTAPVMTVASHALVTGDVIFITSITGSGSNWPGTGARNTPCRIEVVSPAQLRLTSGVNATGWTGSFVAGAWCEGPNVYESGTGEWGWSRRLKYAWIETERFVYASHWGATFAAALGHVRVVEMTSGAAVYVAAVDGMEPINEARRLLIALCGDAQNTGMTFTSDARTTISTPGAWPIQVSDVTAVLRIAHNRPSAAVVYALGRDGGRRRRVPTAGADATGFFVRVRSGYEGDMFFEVQMEASL